MANWSLWSGSLFTLGTVAAGILAYNSVDHDSAAHAAMTLHRNWALPTAALFIGLGILALRTARNNKQPGSAFLSLSAVAAVMLLTTAYLGAEVVYRHGIGVMSLPEVEAGHDHHQHDHGHAVEESSEQSHNH